MRGAFLSLRSRRSMGAILTELPREILLPAPGLFPGSLTQVPFTGSSSLPDGALLKTSITRRPRMIFSLFFSKSKPARPMRILLMCLNETPSLESPPPTWRRTAWSNV